MLKTFWKYELQIFEIFWQWLCETYWENLGATSEIGTHELILRVNSKIIL